MPRSTLSKGLQYLAYWLEALDAHSLHAPFIFDFYTRVVVDDSSSPQLLPVKELRVKLRGNHTIIKSLDLGAGKNRYAHRKISYLAASSHNPKVGRFLYRLARFSSAEKILELGTNLGLSTACLALGAPRAQITTIEGCPELCRLAKGNFQQLAVANIRLLQGAIDDRLPQALSQLNGLDLVFIDANHRYQPTINYFQDCLKEIHQNSVMVVDDIHWSTEMSKAWNEIKAHPRVRISVDLFQLGLLFFDEKLEKHHYILEF